MMKKLIFSLGISFMTLVAAAQFTFEKQYPFYQQAFADVVFSQDDGFVMAFIGQKDKLYFCLIKTDLDGDTLWTKDYDFNITSFGNTVGTQDSEGNMYVSFYRGSKNLAKFSPSGDLIWSTYVDNYSFEMQLTGNTLWMATKGCYLYTMDAATGDSIWRSERFADELGEATVFSMAVKDNGEAVITASYHDGFTGLPFENDFYYRPAGSDTLATFELQTNLPVILYDSKAVGDEILSVGSYHEPNCPPSISYVFRYLTDGTIVSISEQVFPYYCGFYKYVINNDNRLVILGAAFDYNTSHIMLHSRSMEGDSLWTQMIGNDSTTAWDLKLAPDGGYVACGARDQTWDIVQPYLFKTNSLGIITSTSIPADEPVYSVYPNPAYKSVVFEAPLTAQGRPAMDRGVIILTNTLGKVCVEMPITSNKTIVNIEKLKRGLYFYTISNSRQTLSGKLMVR